MWSFCFSLHYRFFENILKTDCIDAKTKFFNITSVLFVLPVLWVSGAKPLWENPTGHNRGGSCVETKLRGQLGYEMQPYGLLGRSSVGLLTSVPGHSIHLHWLGPNSKLSQYETKMLALGSFSSIEFFMSKWFTLTELCGQNAESASDGWTWTPSTYFDH